MTKWSDFLANSSIFTAICATALTFYATTVEHAQIDIYRLTVVFLGTMFSYIGLQLLPISSQRILTSRTSWIKKHKTALIFFMILAFLCIMTCIRFLSFLDNVNFFHLFIIVFFYENFWEGKTKLRKIPYLKSFIIAYIWSCVAVAPHHILNNQSDSLKLWLEIFFLILSLAIPFDVRDKQIDEIEGIKTFATRFSLKTIKLACSICFFLSILISFSYLPLNLKNLLISLSLICYYFLMLSRVRPNQKDSVFLIGLDGIMILKLLYIV